MALDWQAELDRFDPALPVEEAWTPPASWYTDPGLHAHELGRVFRASWQPVARLADLARPGAFVSGRLAGEPWVVVRGEDGELRAFANTCRHKGREVVTGQGRADELVCGYHAWTYRLDGRLSSAPRMAGVRGFEREAMSLPPLRVEPWGPWAFVNLDPDAAPLAPSLAELERRLAATRWEELQLVETVRWSLACNWKVYVDNYLDGGYHVPHMHPTLDAQIDMSSYRTEVFGTYSVQSAGPRAGEPRGDGAGLDYDAGERIGPGALYAWLWPNLMINRYGPCMDTNWVLPRGPDRCEVLYEFYFAPGSADPDFVRRSVEQAAVTQREDIAICESVQVGLRSRSYDRGRYAPGLEVGDHHFHRLLAAALRP